MIQENMEKILNRMFELFPVIPDPEQHPIQFEYYLRLTLYEMRLHNEDI